MLCQSLDARPGAGRCVMSCEQLVEVNAVVRMLRRHQYRFANRGTSVVVEDPVYTSRIGGGLCDAGFKPVVLRSLADARRFLLERS